jgi:DNA-binding NtrC family response regulator
LNPVKILYFGDPGKRNLLDGIDWQSRECEILTAQDEEKAFSILDSADPQVVLVDFDQAGFMPLSFLDKLLGKSKERMVVGLTENSPLDIVVKSIQMGVRDVIHTKDELFKLQLNLSKIVEEGNCHAKGEMLHQKQKENYDFSSILGQSPEMRRLVEIISKIIKRKWVTVLLLGETGTGKELIARVIHYKSYCNYQPFVEVNCNTLPENLLESELFGHEKGAFTDAKTRKKGLFEIARHGTLFLDEIGEINFTLQSKLLRVIEEKKIRRVGGIEDISVNTRIIASTNRDLQTAIKTERFRSDLYYRLNVISIHLPPLRQRGDDVVMLARKFLKDYAEEYKSPVRRFSPDAIALLKEYPWPGNIRELKNTIERIILLFDGEEAGRKTVEEAIQSEGPLVMSSQRPVGSLKIDIPPEGLRLDDVEKVVIREILEKAGWNKRRTCEILHISRPRLDRKIRKYDLKLR